MIISLANSTKHLRENIIPILPNLFRKMEEEEPLLKLLYETNITQMLKLDKYIKRKDNQILISLMNTDAKILKKISK